MSDSQPKRVPAIVFGLGLCVALFVVFAIWGRQGLVDQTPDPYGFWEMGKSLARGEGFDQFGSLLRRRAPLYPIFLSLVYGVFGDSVDLVQFLQCCMFAGTALLAYDLGRRVYNERTGRLAAAACTLHPALLRYVPDFHLETMMVFVTTLAVWMSARFVERPSLSRAAGVGVSMALASLTKAVVMLYPIVFLALWAWRDWVHGEGRQGGRLSLARWAIPAAAVMGAMTLTIAPWTVRNYEASGKFVPISTGANDAFLRGFVFAKTEYITLQEPPYTGAENEVNDWFKELCAKEGAVWEADDVETDRILARAAREKLLAEPLLFVRKTIVGLFTFWYEMTSLTTSLVAGGLALGAWVLAAFGLRRARREGQRAWLLLAPILYLNLLLAVLLSLGRYSVPVLPCLMVLAAFGVDTLLGKRVAPLFGGPGEHSA